MSKSAKPIKLKKKNNEQENAPKPKNLLECWALCRQWVA